MSRRLYLIVCVITCSLPITAVVLAFALGYAPSMSYEEDMTFAMLGNFLISLLTYPAGAIGTLFAYCIPLYHDLLLPSEAVIVAAPLYIGAGYWQWYVLLPKYYARQHARRQAECG